MPDMSREEIESLAAKSTGQARKSAIRAVEGKVSEDNVTQSQHQYNFVDEDLTVRSIDYVGTRLCDFGHAIGQGQQTQITGRCEVCAKFTCSSSTEGGHNCSYSCLRCGKALCRPHAHVYAEGQTYCSNCKWYKTLMILFDGIRKVVK